MISTYNWSKKAVILKCKKCDGKTFITTKAVGNSKTGKQLCETFAIDLPKYGIHTTTICPGFIDTPLTRKNDHPMPFLISGPEGALRIKSAIDNKKVMYVFPKRMALIMHILLRLPRSLYRFIMKLPVANYSKREVAK